MIKQQIQDLLQKDMHRKDFLKHVGIAAVALIGFPSVIKTLSAIDGKTSVNDGLDYSDNAYGSVDSGARNEHKTS